MMFDHVIEWATECFGDSMAIGPRRQDELSPQEHREAANGLAHELMTSVGFLQGVARVVLGEKIFSGSRTMPLVYDSPPRVCVVQTRPAAEYYERIGARVPAPENPGGPHATGVELTVALGTDYSAEYRGRELRVVLGFRVWGAREREAFRRLFEANRRSVEVLLGLEHLEFTTAVPIDPVSAYRGRSVGEMLKRYFPEPDDESNFEIFHCFNAHADPARVIRTYLVLVALYDACFRSSVGASRADDLIPRHLQRIHMG